jgi:hypothetical protein
VIENLKRNQFELFIPIDKVSNHNGDKSLQHDCQCRNGGLCFANPVNGKLCQCVNGFTGPFCEISLCK